MHFASATPHAKCNNYLRYRMAEVMFLFVNRLTQEVVVGFYEVLGMCRIRTIEKLAEFWKV